MSEPEPEPMVLATVTITRSMRADGDIVDQVEAADAEGEDLSLSEALGMMRLAEHSLIELRMSDDDEDDE